MGVGDGEAGRANSGPAVSDGSRCRESSMGDWGGGDKGDDGDG